MLCHADLNDFIESEEEHADVAAESNEDASADEGEDADEPPSRARRAGQIRKAGVARTRGAAKKAQQRIEETEEDVKPARRRRLLRVGPGVSPEVAGLEDSSSGDEESLAARSARLKGKQPAVPEAPNEDEPGPSAEHARWPRNYFYNGLALASDEGCSVGKGILKGNAMVERGFRLVEDS